jgi:putative ABC transport system permease protein
MRSWKERAAERLAHVPIDAARRASIIDEVAAHLEDRYASLVARGASPEEAERAVAIELSESGVLERELRESEPAAAAETPVAGGPARRSALESLWYDVRYGARTLRRSPGFTAVALVTLALGVGANTAIFSVVHTVMLRPLPYEEPDRLVRIYESNPSKGWPTFSASQPNFLDWRAESRTFERLAAQTGAGFTLTSGGDAEIVRAFAVTADLLPLLRVTPALGRGFRPDEDRPGTRKQLALLTHGFWQRRFGAQSSIVGTRITLNGLPYEVIGVLPESFSTAWGGAQLDVLVPLAPDPAQPRGDHRLLVVGRLNPGVSIEQATAELQTIAARLAARYPESNEGWTVAVRSFYDWLVPSEARESLLILLGAVGLVLLIACGNVASLQLARAASRQREFSVRAALGAERSRLIRQLLVESMLLALAAAGLGLLFAYATTKLVVAAAPDAAPRLDELSLDPTVFAFAFGVAIVAAVVFGLAPAVQTASPRVAEHLKESGRSATGGRARQRLRGALVVAEVALSVALLIGAGLLIRSFWRVQQVQPGFDSERLVMMRVTLPRTSYDTNDKSRQFYERLLPGIAALPAVQGATISSGAPLTPGNTSTEGSIPGKTLPQNAQLSADWRLVWPGYFRTMGIPLRGRDFEPADAAPGEGARRVTIVSEEMARRYWPGEDVLGRTVVLRSFDSEPQTIIGVAGDVRSFGLDAQPRPMVYASAMQFSGWNPMNVVVRSAGDPLTHIAEIRALVRTIDPTVPVFDVTEFDELISTSLGARRFNMYLLACFAAIAVVLACVGLFGVLAYLVAQRTRDIGVRMALGANRRDVFRLILGQGLGLAAAGAVLGVAGGLLGARLLRNLLFSVTPADPVTFAAVPLLLLAVAAVACFGPAHRATRVDPLSALRSE